MGRVGRYLVVAMFGVWTLIGMLQLAHAQTCVAGSCTVFLPMAVMPGLANAPAPPPSAPTPSATTPSATTGPTSPPVQANPPTSTPPPATDELPQPLLLLNGDFEQGANVGWQTTGGAFIKQDAAYARNSDWVAVLGGSAINGSYQITQRVTVPPEAPYLTYWFAVLTGWEFDCDEDLAFVKIKHGTETTEAKMHRQFCDPLEHGAYEYAAVNLAAYAGQDVELVFDMQTTGGSTSYWMIDDVAFKAAPGTVVPPEAPEPSPTPEPTPTIAPAVCDPAYPTVCIPPPPPDLNCNDVPFRNFVVLPPDPHHFDRDGDGIGCES